MPYFSEMPTFNYPDFVGGKLKQVNSRNILVRAKIIDYIKRTQAAYLNYTIKDGERPDTVAYKVYGQSEMHWLILLFNEIIDPIFEWPLSTQDLNNAIGNQYSGKTLFIDLRRVLMSIGGVPQSNRLFDGIWYKVGGTVTQGNAVGTVMSWDPNLYKIVIRQDSTASFKVTPNITDPTSQFTDLVHDRGDGFVIKAPVGKVVDDNKYAVHHFENADTGETQDHHALIQNSDGALLDASILDYYAVYGSEVLPLPGKTVVSVSNYQHEVTKNDLKRTIKIMRPELMDVVVKDLRKIFIG